MGPEGWGPEGWGFEQWGPKGGGLPPQFSFFLPSWGSFRGMLVVFEAAGALKCARLEFSGCRVRAPAARSGGAAGVSHDSPRAQLYISGFRPSKTPIKFNGRTPRERKKNEHCGGRREKKSENFGRSGGGLSGGGGFTGGVVQRKGPSEMGCRVRGFGFSGRKQKQNKNKMKREMSKNKKKVKKEKRERRNRANTICSTSAN